MTHDELVEQIRNQLQTRAATVTTPPDVEKGDLGRARTIRRRQFLTQVAPVVGVVALGGITAGVLRSTGSDTAPPAVSASTSASATITASSAVAATPPNVPYLSDGSILHMNGRETPLPKTWAINAISPDGETALLDVSEADDRFAARVTAAGSITEIDSFKPPFTLAGDGRLIAGLAVAPAGAPDTPQGVSLVLVDGLTGKEIARLAAPRALSPELVMDTEAKSVLRSDPLGAVWVWSPARGTVVQLELGGRPLQASVTASADRSVLLTVEESGRMTAWRWPDPTKLWTTSVVADGSPSVSPDGQFVAVPSQRSVDLLEMSTGKMVRQTKQLPGLGPRRMTWEDATHFVASDPDTAMPVRKTDLRPGEGWQRLRANHHHRVLTVTDSQRCDCEDRHCSLKVLGCGLAIAGVTLGVTGFRALVRRVRSRSPAPARSEELA
jgi:hypothetical protein